MLPRFPVIAVSLLIVSTDAPVQAADPGQVSPEHAANMAASAQIFKETIRGFFEKSCLECHGGSKVKSGFNLGSRELLLAGGDRGKSVIPGKPAESKLLKYVRREEEPHMPPKTPASQEIVAALAKWIELGAAYDKALVASLEPMGKRPLQVTEKDRQYWAYRALQTTAIPDVKQPDWARNAIDKFILHKLEAKQITPAADVDRRTLIRRVTFDLTGLPPTPQEIDAFLKDTDANAYEKVVDRLLASEAFGERWARHWLDPARYAESHGFEHDYFRPNAYHYRDFVIKALNQDMPYDQFVKWQIAGDELAPSDPLALAATGFLGAGVYPTQITNREAERIRYDAMDDMLATTGHAMLAMTIGCARCHDHKYDPIPTRDYYRLLAAFTTTVRAEVEMVLGTPYEKQRYAEWEAKLKLASLAAQKYMDQELPRHFVTHVKELKEIPKISEANLLKAINRLRDGSVTEFGQLPAEQQSAAKKWFAAQDEGLQKLNAEVAAITQARPAVMKVKIQVTTEGKKPMRHHTADGSIPDFYPKTFYLKRGDLEQKDGEAELGFLQVLNRSQDEKAWLAVRPPQAETSFRRASIANWLTDSRHGAGALAARVIVNRLWHHHFGRGIVATLNDFGFQGDPPTHPELLEWLAGDLVEHGWKLKRVHKLMVMSRAYQLSGTPSASGKKLDPENKLWHTRPRRRLEAEAIRDNLYAVSGLLDRTMYGPGTLDQNMKRRSIYFSVQRSQMIPFLQVFDWPDSLTSAAARSNTTVAPQALLFMNSPQVRACAAGLANRLKPVAEKDPAAAIRVAYETAFGRLPTARETEDGLAFLREKTGAGQRDRALQDYALVLLSVNEFIFVE